MACVQQWPQPEQDGQANRTWSNIVQNPTKQHSCAGENKQLQLSQAAAALDYIPLESDVNLNRDDIKDNKQLKRKLPSDKVQQHSNGYISTSKNLYCTPWKTRNYVQDPTGLNEEIQDFVNYIKPRPQEDAIRMDVVERVKAVITDLWPNAKVELYGSCQTGLYLPTSDIDLVVHGKWESLPLRTLENKLIEQEIADANSIRVLDKATVPIIKATDTKTQVKIDISFNMNNCVQSADMIKTYMKQYPALRYLTFVLKQFLVDRDLNEVFCGGINSHSLVLMIVSFLQHSEHFKNTDIHINLGVLLIEFFELYGKKFNYYSVGIRLVDGSYFNKEKVLGKSLANATYLCIEDPLTKGNYIGKGSFRINDIKLAFEWAYSTLTHGVLHSIPGNESSSILGRITRVRRDVVEQREKMLRLSPCTSPSLPSYASVATRNTTRARKISSTQDSECNSKHDTNNGSPRCSDKSGHNDKQIASKVHRYSTSRQCSAKDSQTDVNWRKNRQSSKEKRREEQERKENYHDRKKSLEPSPTREEERSVHSPSHKHSSPKRMTHSCAMGNKTVKPVKEIQQRPSERLLCR